jgi:hypothetical protein
MTTENSFEYYEVPAFGNIKFVIDANGNGWFCPSDASGNENLSSQGCERADSVTHDRAFGG